MTPAAASNAFVPPSALLPARITCFTATALWVRIGHWTNAVCLAILLMSGLNILNAHPALYFGGNGLRFLIIPFYR